MEIDLSIENGFIFQDGEIVEEDIGVRDGEIVKVGELESDADRVIDASDSFVLPGMVNTHTHASMTLFRGYADDLPLDEWLQEKIWPIESGLEPEDVYAGARLACLEMIKTGTTAFADMYFSMDKVAEAVEESGMKAVLGYGMIGVGKDEEGARSELETGINFAREYSNYANGRVKTMITPHAPYTCDDWMIEEAREVAREESMVFHTHLSETEGEVEDIVEEERERPAWYLDRLDAWDEDSYVAHAVHLDDGEIDLLARNGVSVAHCPSANMKLASGIAPIAEMVSKGVNVAVGTDGVASNNNLDMFEETRKAALLSKVNELDASVIPAPTALRMATRNGAEALGLSSGEIEEGKDADFAILDLDEPHLTPQHDLVSHAVYAAKGSDVKTTVVNGEVVMEEGEVKTLDEEKVKREAQEAAERLVEKVEN